MFERSEAQKRETALKNEVIRLRDALAQAEVARAQVETNVLMQERATHGTEVQSQISELRTQMKSVVDQLKQLKPTIEMMMNKMQEQEDRIVALENWETPKLQVYEDAVEHFDDEDELVPGHVSPPRSKRTPTAEANRGLGSGGLNYGFGSNAFDAGFFRETPFRTNHGTGTPAFHQMRMLEDSLRWKDVSSVRMPSLPDSAGAFRGWRNAVLPSHMALHSPDENHLYRLLKAFNARAPDGVHTFKEDRGFSQV